MVQSEWRLAAAFATTEPPNPFKQSGNHVESVDSALLLLANVWMIGAREVIAQNAVQGAPETGRIAVTDYVLINAASYVSLGINRKWVQIGIRVLASWIIAISLLVLAFSLRK